MILVYKILPSCHALDKIIVSTLNDMNKSEAFRKAYQSLLESGMKKCF